MARISIIPVFLSACSMI
uniref:Uncharacterized protein n=1 Tax=Arundo donax TaxID=35708 RepID=A0A0A9H4D7_ARUDO